jgi:UDP:flavonoid glycosyltransferase YjiC (YdhE family)
MAVSVHEFSSVARSNAVRHRSPRILFVGEAVSLAHVGRPAALARWTRAAGYDVHFACGSAFASVVRAEGFALHDLQTLDAATFYSRLNAGKFFYTADELESCVSSELELIEELQPDLIVGDFRLTLSISAKLAGVPLVSLNNAHWSPAAECRFSPPDMGIYRILPAALRDALFSLVRPIAFRTFARPLNVVRRRFGLPAPSDFRELYTAGEFCAYMDLPELSDIRARPLPHGHFFLGPVAWEPSLAHQPDLGSLGTQRPLAYVTLGSSGDARVLPDVLRALLAADCDIAMSGVSADRSHGLHAMLPRLNGRCLNAPLLNPHEVLKRAAVTVCHGGSGTVYQSLAAGVPLLCLPGNPDQGLVSATVAAKNAGIVVEPRHATSANLKAALGALLNVAAHTFSAKYLSECIAKHDTRRCWTDFLGRVLPVPAGTPNFQDRQIQRVPELAR